MDACCSMLRVTNPAAVAERQVSLLNFMTTPEGLGSLCPTHQGP